MPLGPWGKLSESRICNKVVFSCSAVVWRIGPVWCADKSVSIKSLPVTVAYSNRVITDRTGRIPGVHAQCFWSSKRDHAIDVVVCVTFSHVYASLLSMCEGMEEGQRWQELLLASSNHFQSVIAFNSSSADAVFRISRIHARIACSVYSRRPRAIVSSRVLARVP